MIKQKLIQKPELKQKLSLSRSMKRNLETLKQSSNELLRTLTSMANNNPFLEFTPSLKGQEYLETGIAQGPNLKEELYFQLHTNRHPYHKEAAQYIIESLDNHGFFSVDIHQACLDTKTDAQTFVRTLEYIQTFEPAGVAAKNSEDSLIIQLKLKGWNNAAKFLSMYKEEIIKQDFSAVCRKEHITMDTIQTYFEQIRTCHPNPCQGYDTSATSYTLPEFEIKIQDDQLLIEPQSMGEIRLSEKAEKNELSEELKNYFNQAKFMIDSLHRRNKTLLIIANELFEIQKYHFLYQDELKACTLKELSVQTGFSQSTISRTLHEKYYLFQGKLYPLSDLLISSTKSGSSKDAIIKAIQTYIENEDKKQPLQDEQLQQKLENIELFASRRTIAKYREQLNIPNSKNRKKIYQNQLKQKNR